MVERRIIFGDCRKDMLEHGPFDMLLADPPYGDTSLDWDRRCEGWIEAAGQMLKPSGSMWVFGSVLAGTGHSKIQNRPVRRG